MIRWLIERCLQARVLVVLAAAVLLVLGLSAGRDAPVDAFPEFAPPSVEVQTEAPGLSSLDVELLVTTPLENVLSGVPFVKTVRSKSVMGLSSVVLWFDRDVELLIARQLVQERLARAAALLPVAARPPVMMPPLSSTSRAMKVGLTSKSRSQVELSELVRWTLRPRLLAIPGVANVAVWGAREREYHVELDVARLQAHAVSVDELIRGVRGATQPLAGGFLDGPNQRLPLTHAAPVRSIAELGALPIATRNGAVIRVDDLATVSDTVAPPIGDAVINDGPGLLLIVEKQPWGNTLEITRRVDQVLAAVAPAMPDVTFDAHLFRPAAFIERSIGNLEEALLLGCVLVVAVLWVFLWNWRTALISSLAIPLSLAAALLVLRALGGTLNTMILAGLVIALGEVVDDAIIDVENIYRRLRENAGAPSPRSVLRVVLDASIEVRGAVVYATLIVVLVFLPVWFLGGLSGAFFRPLALAYGLAVLASLGVALTITPALSMLLLPRSSLETSHSPVLRWATRRYDALLPRLLSSPRPVLLAGALSMAFAVVSALFLGTSFLPEFKESDFLMHWVAQPGTSLTALRRTTERVSVELRALDGVSSFGAHLGRAEAADEVVGPNFGELWIHVDDRVSHDEVSRQVLRVIARYPGLRRDLETYLRERVREVLTGAPGAIVVRVFGPELDTLRSSAQSLVSELQTVPGVSAVRVEQQALVPEVRAAVKPEAAALGFLSSDVRGAIDLFVRGQRVGELLENGRSIPVVITGPLAAREDVTSLRDMRIEAASGTRALLGDVAALTIEPTPNVVPHEDTSRKIDVSIDVSGDLSTVAKSVEALVARTRWPAAHHAEVLGEWKEREAATWRLAGFGVLSFLLVLVVLYLDLQSVRRTALVAASLPFALVGGAAGAWLTGGVLSLGSLVGLVTVLGIAARNGILLVTHYRHLEDEGAPFGAELVRRASLERLGPILMTACATGLALVPLVIAGDTPGHEIEHPMAVVVLGGLVSSTVLNLLVLPVVYLRFGRVSSATPLR